MTLKIWSTVPLSQKPRSVGEQHLGHTHRRVLLFALGGFDAPVWLLPTVSDHASRLPI